MSKCPQCGSPLEFVRNCVIEDDYVPKYPLRNARSLPRKTRKRPAVLCTGCEFAEELVQ